MLIFLEKFIVFNQKTIFCSEGFLYSSFPCEYLSVSVGGSMIIFYMTMLIFSYYIYLVSQIYKLKYLKSLEYGFKSGKNIKHQRFVFIWLWQSPK